MYLQFILFLHTDISQVVKNPSSWKSRTFLFNIANIMTADDLATSQGIRSHAIDLIKPRWLGPYNLRVKCGKNMWP